MVVVCPQRERRFRLQAAARLRATASYAARSVPCASKRDDQSSERKRSRSSISPTGRSSECTTGSWKNGSSRCRRDTRLSELSPHAAQVTATPTSCSWRATKRSCDGYDGCRRRSAEHQNDQGHWPRPQAVGSGLRELVSEIAGDAPGHRIPERDREGARQRGVVELVVRRERRVLATAHGAGVDDLEHRRVHRPREPLDRAGTTRAARARDRPSRPDTET